MVNDIHTGFDSLVIHGIHDFRQLYLAFGDWIGFNFSICKNSFRFADLPKGFLLCELLEKYCC